MEVETLATDIEKFVVAKLELRAGDVLVIQSDRRLPKEVMDRISGHVQPHLPDGVKILVIDPSITLSTLSAADIAARTS